jgi:hypothetical protein
MAPTGSSILLRPFVMMILNKSCSASADVSVVSFVTSHALLALTVMWGREQQFVSGVAAAAAAERSWQWVLMEMVCLQAQPRLVILGPWYYSRVEATPSQPPQALKQHR